MATPTATARTPPPAGGDRPATSLLVPDDDMFVRWWDPRLARPASTLTPAPPAAADAVPDADDVPDMLPSSPRRRTAFPTSAASPRTDSLSSTSTAPAPATPDSGLFPLPALPPVYESARGAASATHLKPSHAASASVDGYRRPSTASASAVSIASTTRSRATPPRGILSRANSSGGGPRRAGSVKFVERPVVLSCRFEADEFEDALDHNDDEEDEEDVTITAPPPRAPTVYGSRTDVRAQVPDGETARRAHAPREEEPPMEEPRPKKKRGILHRLVASLSFTRTRPPKSSAPAAAPPDPRPFSPASASSLRNVYYPFPSASASATYPGGGGGVRAVPQPLAVRSNETLPRVPAVRAWRRRSVDSARAAGGPLPISGPLPLGSASARAAAANASANWDSRSVRSVKSAQSWRRGGG